MNTHLCATAKGPRGPIKPLLDWRTLNEKMPWSLYLLLGGGFAIAQAAEVLIIISTEGSLILQWTRDIFYETY